MKSGICLTALCLLALTAACGPESDTGSDAAAGYEQPADVDQTMAIGFVEATLEPLGDSGVQGKVTFNPSSQGVRVQAEISGLKPGKHGFHIHEIGDCSSPDGKSAGGHFNPAEVDHAGPGQELAHAGDLGNLKADDRGDANLTMVSTRITLGDGAATDIMGRAVIVHADPDDLVSQPTGAAGGRVACGVIISAE
jgi:Cu-Zn family superoxide dismutase